MTARALTLTPRAFSEMADIFGLEYLAEHGNAARV
jgi:hypothetical protein